MARLAVSAEYLGLLRDAPRAVRQAVRAVPDLPPRCKGGEPVDDAATHVFLPAPGATPDPTSGLFGAVLFVGQFADLNSLRQGIRDRVQDAVCLGEEEHVVVGPAGAFLPVAARGDQLQCDQLFCPQDRTDDVRKRAQTRRAGKEAAEDAAAPSMFSDDGASIRPDVLKWQKDRRDARTQRQREREEYAQKLGVLDAIELDFEPAHEFLQDGEDGPEAVAEALRHLDTVRQRRAEIHSALTTNAERLQEAEEGAVRFQERLARLEAETPAFRDEWRAVYAEALRQTGQALPDPAEISALNPMKYLVLSDEELAAVAPA